MRNMVFWGVLWIVNSVNVVGAKMSDSDFAWVPLVAGLICGALFVYYYIKENTNGTDPDARDRGVGQKHLG